MEIQNLEVFKKFVSNFKLDSAKIKLFTEYYNLLKEWNDIHNLTAIESPEKIVLDHFWDSMAFADFFDISKVNSIADVGAGAGFPGIPLKIVYPHLELYLIEVSQKKVAFLEEVKYKLQLSNVHIIDQDWRTFLRKTEYKIDFFVSRAALDVPELIRFLKPGCFYKSSNLVYWASKAWDVTEKDKQFLKNTFEYKVGNKNRKLILFAVE